MTGLYDHQGILRFTGRDPVECIEYAELFALAAGSYSIACLEKGDWGAEELPAAGLFPGDLAGAADRVLLA